MVDGILGLVAYSLRVVVGDETIGVECNLGLSLRVSCRRELRQLVYNVEIWRGSKVGKTGVKVRYSILTIIGDCATNLQ